MKEKTNIEFQKNVEKYLIRHKSIFDIMTKYQESTAKVNRALAKSITECGCIQVKAQKQELPTNIPFNEICKFMSSHVEGEMCPHCKEVLTKEIGHAMFYMVAMCNLAGLDMDEIMQKENSAISTLGFYYLS